MSYDLWGNPTESGPGALTDFGFTGHYLDRPSGLNLPLYRGYSAPLGRWLSRDPIGLRGGFNLYGYVLNDPVDLIDPDGRVPLVAGACMLGGCQAAASAAASAAVWTMATLGAAWAGTELGKWLAKGRKHDTRQVDQIARDLELSRDQVRNAIERIKKAARLRPNDNVDFLPDGTVIDPVSGDEIGNIGDEACGKR